MSQFTSLAAIALLAALISPARAEIPTTPQIDYPAFETLVRELGPVRAAHRLAWDEFSQAAKADGALLLDTRSAADFARGHIAGAVNLPFSEFMDEKLRTVIGGDPRRPIYIYCNNNFADNVAPVMLKRAPLALNIPTFINLHGYGFTNVWELAGEVSITDPRVGWVNGQARTD